MKKTRIAKTLTAAGLTAAMVMSMGGMTAFAAKPLEVTKPIEWTKTVTTDGNTYAPDTKFDFTIESGTGQTLTIDGKTVSTKAGVEGGLLFSWMKDGLKQTGLSTSLSFAPGEAALPNYTQTANLEVVSSAFDDEDGTGVYHYTVKETIPSSPYPGVKYSTDTYNVFLYVYERDGWTAESQESQYYVGNVVITKNDATITDSATNGKQADVNFINEYGKDEDGKEIFHDLTVTKKVSGVFGELNKPFEITVEITNAAGDANGKRVYKVEDKGVETTLTYSNGKYSGTFSLMNEQSVEIFGLAEDDSIVIFENESVATTDGYTVSFAKLKDNQETAMGKETGFEAKMDDVTIAEDTNILVKNDKGGEDGVTPTGIILNFAPYIALVAFAGVFAGLFLRKRKEEF